MGLAEDLANDDLFKRQKGETCRVCRFLSELEESTRKAFQARLDNKEISAAQLSKFLKDKKYADIPANSVARHRRAECVGQQ